MHILGAKQISLVGVASNWVPVIVGSVVFGLNPLFPFHTSDLGQLYGSGFRSFLLIQI